MTTADAERLRVGSNPLSGLDVFEEAGPEGTLELGDTPADLSHVAGGR